MKKNYRVSLWNVLLLMGAIIFLGGCPQANEPSGGGEQQGEIKSEELKGVWELFVAANQQTSNIFLYFDGTTMYSAVKAGGQFTAIPAGTPFLQYKDGKLQYGASGSTTVEFVGKKNGKNIDLYAKVNGQVVSVASYTLKPSTESGESIKEAGTEEPCTGPCIRSIMFDRKHLAYNDANLTVTVALSGKNFNLIASQPDTDVKAGLFDTDDVLQGGLVKVTDIDTVNHRATVSLPVPQISAGEATVEGKKYMVRVKICGKYAKVQAPLTITKEARLTENPALEKSLIPSNEVSASTTVKMTVKGATLR